MLRAALLVIAIAAPAPHFKPRAPAPQFLPRAPVPAFVERSAPASSLPIATPAVSTPQATAPGTEAGAASGHWEQHCTGSGCQLMWVSEQFQPVLGRRVFRRFQFQ